MRSQRGQQKASFERNGSVPRDMSMSGLSERLDAARHKTSGSSLAAWGRLLKPPLQAGPSASQRGHGGEEEGREQTDREGSLIKERRAGL